MTGRPGHGPGPTPRSRDERGAVAITTALVLSLVLVVVAAIAVDLGMQRSARRDMQAVADLVALDLGRLIDGRTRAEIESGAGGDPSAATQLSWSVANNSADAIGDDLEVTAYWVEVAEDGSFPEADGIPVQVAADAVPNGVVVLAGADVTFAFAGVTGVASGDVERAAVATAEESACFSIGSYAARLDTSSSALLDGILEGILGGGVDLDVLSYSGIAGANVRLLDVALQLGLGSVEELLSSNVNAGNLLIAAAEVLQADGTSHANILNLVAAQLGGLSLDVGELVSAEPGSGAAEVVTINALDLLAGAVLIANGTNAISVPGLTTNLPFAGTDMTSSLSIIEKARTRCGRRGSQAETAQVALNIGGTLVSLPTVLGLTPTNATTQIALNVASARGTLTDIICGSETPADPSGEDVQVTSGAVGASATIKLDFNGTASGSGPVNGLLSGITRLLQTILTPIVQITVSGSLEIKVETGESSTARTAQIRVPNHPPSWDDPVSTGSGDLGLSSTSYTVTSNDLVVSAKGQGLLGLVNVNLEPGEITSIVDNLLRAVAGDVLNPLVTSINSNLLHPLYDVLGLSVGGADVFGQPPYCSNPSLVG